MSPLRRKLSAVDAQGHPSEGQPSAKSGVRQNLATVVEALERMHVRRASFVSLAALGAVATVCQLVGFGLLVPLVHLALADVPEGGPLRRFGIRFEALGTGSGAYAILIAGILLAVLIRGIASYRASRGFAELTALAETHLAGAVLSAHLRFGQQHYDTTSLSAHENLVRKAPDHGRWVLRSIEKSLQSTVSFVLYLAAMIWLAPGLAALTMVVLSGYLYLFDRLVQKVEDLDLREESADQDNARKVHDLLDNLPLVRMQGTTDGEVDAFVRASNRAARLRVEKRRLLDLTDPLKDVANAIVLVSFVVLAAAWLAGSREADVARYLVFFLILRRAMQRFSGVLSIPSRLTEAARRMRLVDDALDASDKLVVPSGTRPFTGLRRSLRVDGLTFAYKRKAVLDGVSLDIEAGRTSYVVGATGSGKSTLFKLWIRLYDCPPGSIFFDGVDLRELRTEEVLERVSYCPSRPLLFDDTIRRNVSYGLGDIDEAELWKAARQARVDTFLESLDAKLDEVVGPRGSQISVGESQRLALMRLFLKRPDLILLDEATSGLDSATEGEIWRELDRRFAGCTMVVIAHRLSMIPASSPVIVMNQGRVVEQGERDQLLAGDGEFARLWSATHRSAFRASSSSARNASIALT